MTDDMGSPRTEYRLGDVANDHLLTTAGWVRLRYLPADAPGPYYSGDSLRGSAFTGIEWVRLPSPGDARALPAGGASSSASLSPQAPNGTRRRARGWLIALAATALIALVTVVVAANAKSDSKSTAAASTPPAPTPTPAPSSPETTQPTKPAPQPTESYASKMKKLGWEQWADDLWGKTEPGDSTTFSITWKLRIVSPTGCPYGVYVAANVLDTSKTVVGFTNDMLPSLEANQQAVLDLTTSAQSSDGTLYLSPTEARCS